MPLTFNGFPLLTTTEVRGEARAKWPPFGRAYQSLICLSVVFALLFTLSFSVSSLFMAIAALIMQCAMWLGNGNWLNDAAIVTICHSPFNVGCTPQCHIATLPHATHGLSASRAWGINLRLNKIQLKVPARGCRLQFQLAAATASQKDRQEGQAGGKGEREKHTLLVKNNQPYLTANCLLLFCLCVSVCPCSWQQIEKSTQNYVQQQQR